MKQLQKAENKTQFIYYKELQISSEQYQMNRVAMIESNSEKVLDIVHKVFNIG
ncbi:unnamed protein product [Paramecium pentaurelia]|uniref:Uncharacterized protein n=1 Tax=Paramecium pentaurelia TaxID=43138 RepID=A0A8S1YLU8_9CILI|nr:unnamed protein product [Paramecium pentaurelia]